MPRRRDRSRARRWRGRQTASRRDRARPESGHSSRAPCWCARAEAGMVENRHATRAAIAAQVLDLESLGFCPPKIDHPLFCDSSPGLLLPGTARAMATHHSSATATRSPPEALQKSLEDDGRIEEPLPLGFRAQISTDEELKRGGGRCLNSEIQTTPMFFHFGLLIGNPNTHRKF